MYILMFFKTYVKQKNGPIMTFFHLERLIKKNLPSITMTKRKSLIISLGSLLLFQKKSLSYQNLN